jgi:hypothetical protein
VEYIYNELMPQRGVSWPSAAPPGICSERKWQPPEATRSKLNTTPSTLYPHVLSTVIGYFYGTIQHSSKSKCLKCLKCFGWLLLLWLCCWIWFRWVNSDYSYCTWRRLTSIFWRTLLFTSYVLHSPSTSPSPHPVHIPFTSNRFPLLPARSLFPSLLLFFVTETRLHHLVRFSA